jgi:hypothetical protein
METIDNRSFKEKVTDSFRRGVDWTKQKAENIGTVIKDHPQETLAVVCILGPGLLKCANSAIRYRQQQAQLRYDECDYYDNRTAEHWYTKRPLTTREKLELERRYQNGESKGSILKSKGLI